MPDAAGSVDEPLEGGRGARPTLGSPFGPLVTTVPGSLRFYFGTMGAGKSTLALQIHHNLSQRGSGLLLTRHDREGASVSSALGVSARAVVVTDELDVLELVRSTDDERGLDFVVCDEAQFYAPHQVDQLADVADELGIDVYAFGLLTDFRGHLFPATARLLELADERNELHVQARCWCGAAATHNARLVDGEQVYAGDVVVIDDGSHVTYELRCRLHWRQGRGPDQPALFDGVVTTTRRS